MAVFHDEGKGGMFIAVGIFVGAIAGAIVLAAPERSKARAAHRVAGCTEELNDQVYLPAAARAKRDDDRSEEERAERIKKDRKDKKARKNSAMARGGDAPVEDDEGAPPKGKRGRG